VSENHAWTHAPNGADAIEASYEIKVFLDENHPAALLNPELAEVVVGDGVFIWPVPRDVAGAYLREAEAGVSTAGGVTIQIRNVTQAVDMLSTKVTIDGGEFTSYTAATPSVVNVLNSRVELGDLLAIDIDAISGTPKGLAAILNFGPRLSL
jgi:hypothetical protein